MLLGVLVLMSFAVGSRAVGLGEVWSVLWHPDRSQAATVVHDLRIPRAAVLVVVGVGLGLAGALMQSITRNPLADPGILGVNAGASLAVVVAVLVSGTAVIGFYVWFAFVGAALAAVVVYVLGAVGRAATTPGRLALAGVAVSAAIGSLVQTLILADQTVFNEFRFWAAGSAEGRGYSELLTVAPFVVLGAVIALAMGPSLNALALGEEAGRGLGVRVGRVRGWVMVSVTLLCGAATAAAGPIGFVGLGVPFLARAICGPDQRWVLPYCLVLGPALLMVADMLARVVVAPQEVPVGVVTALLGGPVFVAIVRRRRIEAL